MKACLYCGVGIGYDRQLCENCMDQHYRQTRGLKAAVEKHNRNVGNYKKQYRVKFIFARYDLWVGFFWDRKKRWLYIFPMPLFGLIIKFKQ